MAISPVGGVAYYIWPGIHQVPTDATPGRNRRFHSRDCVVISYQGDGDLHLDRYQTRPFATLPIVARKSPYSSSTTRLQDDRRADGSTTLIGEKTIKCLTDAIR